MAGATFSEPFWMRLIRFLCLDDFRWLRWPQMLSHTLTMTRKCVSEPESFFVTQLIQLLQRMLRSIKEANCFGRLQTKLLLYVVM